MTNSKQKILQFGTGNFLRGFIEPMVQTLQEKGYPLEVILIQSTGGNTLEELKKQEFNYTLHLAGLHRGVEVNEEKKISCITQGISLPQDWEIFISYSRDPEVKWILSNVTEAGLVWEAEHEATVPASSFPARLTQWLYQRFRYLPQQHTNLLPCELLPSNGELLKKWVKQHAKNWSLSEDFFSWMESTCKFYTTLVDRIVPGFPRLEKQPIEQFKDRFAVQAEPYCFWGIQGGNSDRANLPFLDSDHGVVLCDSLDFFTKRKITLLNGLHTYMASLGKCRGITTVREYLMDEKRLAEVQHLLFEELLPYLSGPQESLQLYAAEVMERLLNPFVQHQLRDISLHSISKFSSRLKPVCQFYEAKEVGLPKELAKGLVALCLVMLRFTDEMRDTEENLKQIEKIKKQRKNEFERVIQLSQLFFGLSSRHAIQSAYKEISNADGLVFFKS
ncbi:MAG: tagaturonate reductase [Bacteroidetes bacterium]|nr:tagaturonate reductase [Bacteroidota bacterium]